MHKCRLGLTALSLIGVFVGVLGLPALAATITVTTLADNTTDDGFCTLREAILAANNTPANANCGAGSSAADTITFSVGGVITLGSQLPNIVTAATAGTLTINGGGNITISGNNAVRVLRVDSGANLTLQNLTVADGSHLGEGAGIYNDGGTLTITNSTFSGNRAGNAGGGIINYGTLTITNSTFSGNSAGNEGGGIYNASGGTATITNSTFSGNSTTGGIGSGGGIYNNGTATITNSTLSGNSARFGGGIYNFRTAIITNSTFSGNSAPFGFGGGIFNSTVGTVTITNSTLSGNSASVGGGILNDGGTMTITNSTLSGNSATFNGGGIRNDGTVTITNSTLSGNSADSHGGGIFNGSGGTLTITNSTFSANSAGSTGGGIRNNGTATLKNTIVANSTGGNCFGTVAASGTNFATDASCAGFTQVTSAQLALGPLANNGGPTQTHALLTGSVAIDAATDCTDVNNNPVSQDQRGVSRPQGVACDSGAFELSYRTLTVLGAGAGSGTVTGTGISCTITAGSTSGDCTESYASVTVVTLTATPTAGSALSGWTNCDSPSGNQCTMTMTADKNVTATFNPAYTLGDVNNDGKINTLDARMAQQHADGVITLTGNAFLAADVDVDSDVDSNDATAIAKKGIGLPTGIPGFALGPHPRPLSVNGEGWPQAGVRWLFLVFTLPALAFLRRNKRLATLLLVSGLSVLTGCVEFAGLAPPPGPAIYLTSTSMPNGATRIIDLMAQQITTGGGAASLQGRITYPSGVAIQSVTGLNGFVVKAICGTVGDPCASPGELRLSLVKPSVGGVSHGAILRLAVQASGASGQVYTLSWAGNAQTPIVLGSDANSEITGYTLGNGQVKVR